MTYKPIKNRDNHQSTPPDYFKIKSKNGRKFVTKALKWDLYHKGKKNLEKNLFQEKYPYLTNPLKR